MAALWISYVGSRVPSNAAGGRIGVGFGRDAATAAAGHHANQAPHAVARPASSAPSWAIQDAIQNALLLASDLGADKLTEAQRELVGSYGEAGQARSIGLIVRGRPVSTGSDSTPRITIVAPSRAAYDRLVDDARDAGLSVGQLVKRRAFPADDQAR